MGQFKFRLATLLRLAETARDERRTQLSEAYKALRILEEQAADMAARIERMKEQARAASCAGRVDIDALLAAHRYQAVLDNQTQTITERTKQVNQEVERRREALVEADRQVRLLEKLKERRREEHRMEEEVKEVKQMDEAAAVRRR